MVENRHDQSMRGYRMLPNGEVDYEFGMSANSHFAVYIHTGFIYFAATIADDIIVPMNGECFWKAEKDGNSIVIESLEE